MTAMLSRRQLFEFNDLPWTPTPMRESLVEALSLMLSWGHVLRGLAEPFAAFLDSTGASEVLDLCSGAGGPAVILAQELRRARRQPPKFLLTDLNPHPAVWKRLAARSPDVISFVSDSVDATAIPPTLGQGRPRMIVNALHHLPPSVAGEVVRGACAGGPGIFIAEGFERNPLRFIPMMPMGVIGMLALPLVSPRQRLAKLAFLPLSLTAGLWDGIVSTLRVYSERELREMVAPLGPAFEWRYGTYPFPLGGRGYWFSGVRVR